MFRRVTPAFMCLVAACALACAGPREPGSGRDTPTRTADAPRAHDPLVSSVDVLPEIGPSPAGNRTPLAVAAHGDTAVVTILSIPVNCCTDSVTIALELGDGGADFRVLEHATKRCECFNRRALRFTVAPFNAAGRRFRVFLNANPRPAWDSLAVTLPD